MLRRHDWVHVRDRQINRVVRWFCESKLVKMIVCSYFVLFFKLGRKQAWRLVNTFSMEAAHSLAFCTTLYSRDIHLQCMCYKVPSVFILLLGEGGGGGGLYCRHITSLLHFLVWSIA